jgi:signal transduction histidine kinase
VATLAGGIAHDFNNLLGSIIGLAELSGLDAAKGSRQARNIGRIGEAGDKAAALVRQLLDFSRQTPPSLQRMSMAELLANVDGLLRAVLPPDVTLALGVDEDGPVSIDVVQMEQVLLNIVRNAAQAMQETGGEIRIVVDRAEPGAGTSAGRPGLVGPGHVRLRAIDTGEGIAPEVLDKIFEPFFTTKPLGEGTGLGLAAVHGIVSGHDGVIEVASERWVGTTFSIFLPLAQSAGAAPGNPGAAAAQAHLEHADNG